MSLHLRVALPQDGSRCAIDSATVLVRAPNGPDRAIPMAVSDTVLEAIVADLDSAAVGLTVSAYGDGGKLAYYCESAWDPAVGNGTVTIVAGRVGRMRMDAGFRPGGID